MRNSRNFLFAAWTVLVWLCLFVPAFGAGEVDTTFNGYLGKLGAARAYQSVIQPDGKIIVTGNFTMVNGFPRYTIVRLNTDGTLDTTFNSPINVTVGLPVIEAVGIQSNGKIVIGGSIGLKRLNPDGSFDTAFNYSPSVNTVVHVYDLKITPEDKIVFSGTKSTTGNVINRLNSDGSLETEATFSGFVFRIAVAPDGKIVYVQGAFSPVKRLNQNLTPDNSFAPVNINHTVYKLIVQPDGKTLIQGIITQVNGTNSPRLVRVNTDGTVDVTFVNNVSTGATGINALELLPNGKVLTGTVLRNSDGTLDNTFSASNNLNIYDVDVQSDGRVIVSGELPTESSAIQSSLSRFNPDGTLDTSFQARIGAFGYGNQVIVQPDNKILVSGDFNYASGAARPRLARLNADGTIDNAFNTSIGYGLLDIFNDGKILVVNSNRVYRLNSDGSQDIVFPGTIAGITGGEALPDGRVLIARGTSLERYNTDGTLDSTFNVSANAAVYDVALQANGKIMIGGVFTQINGVDRSRIARLNADGTLDSSFNSPSGGINHAVLQVELTIDGNYVIRGAFSGISFNTREGLARLNADGSLDLSFVPPPSFSTDDVKVQTDGKVLLGGVNRCQRLNSNGTLDTSFNCAPSVVNNDTPRVRGIALQSDGKIIVAGDFLRINGVVAPGIARLLNTTKSFFDYDGDGRADVSVFRSSENRWYLFLSGNSTVSERSFGLSGDVLTPADYDGDGKTDIGVFRPSNGNWWYLSSVDGTQKNFQWGASGDIPRPADFDADGRADLIVFRPAENTWYRYGTSAGISIINFGLAGDKPVSGDFDGDGRADVAIYRPSTGDWWWRSSIDANQRAIHWGISSDTPAPADFDGDGRTDFAVYRSSEGVWYIYNSTDGSFTIRQFGLAEDKPVPADYDGDGRADLAVFRPSTGIWYQMRSTAGFWAQQFGVSTDTPTPNAFVP